MDSIQGNPRYTFYRRKMNGQTKDGLVTGFLRTMLLAPYQEAIELEDGSKFKVVHEPAIARLFAADTSRTGLIKTVISFQVYSDGEAIAVARLYNKDKGHYNG